MGCETGRKKSQDRYDEEMAKNNDNVVVSIIPTRWEEVSTADDFSRQQNLHRAVGVKKAFVFYENVEYEEAEIDRQN
ncbi:hypothetical protein MesoLj113b_51190 [Mesorhizobium sp. 113-3-3]|nr:hypothetical protein MesoLj113b_51190 [Mesorhizobium sp. 113-3-3]